MLKKQKVLTSGKYMKAIGLSKFLCEAFEINYGKVFQEAYVDLKDGEIVVMPVVDWKSKRPYPDPLTTTYRRKVTKIGNSRVISIPNEILAQLKPFKSVQPYIKDVDDAYLYFKPLYPEQA